MGAVHALSYPLGANYHVPHGEANYQFLVETFKLYNEKQPAGDIQQINQLLACELKLSTTNNYNTVYDALAHLLDQLIRRRPLHEYGMKSEKIKLFAANVIVFQQRLLNNNHVPLSEEEISGVYERLF